MIWYLLYPVRGTTEPPVLGPNHPVRKAFYYHGSSAAQHPYISILVSVATGVILCYPFPHLYSNSTAGSSGLPHHVWTSARPFEGSSNTAPDVGMRQIWVHGSHMRAIELDVLQEALTIQNALLGQMPGYEKVKSMDQATNGQSAGLQIVKSPASRHIASSFRDLDWLFHSPLLHWNCSSSAIADENNLLATINGQVHRITPAGLTLRHSTVFAGKTFMDQRLVAADAVVITFIYRQGSSVAKHWEDQASALATSPHLPWSLYPKDGRVTGSQPYEFRFQPMSLSDDLFLALAYLCMALYVLVSLRKLRAVKSRFGLVVTGVTKILTAVCSSFTVCAVFNVNLSQIPREVYPLVVLAIGVENMFRLINAVLVTPPEMPTVSRIANALGDIGHLSLAAAGQNLFILWLLSKVVSPGVAAFCTFAAVAVVFDFLFHLTFFVAVLSVDVKRFELQDCLDRAETSISSSKSSNTGRQTWGGALVEGKLPIRTRVAGTAIVICSVAALNWHFLEDANIFRSPFRLSRLLCAVKSSPESNFSGVLAQSMNQVRSPTAWLRLQDHDTAREAIRAVKPQAHSFVAQVYDPLVIVLRGADRGGNQDSRSLMAGVLRTVRAHSFPFALALVLSIAAVTLLMSYLLWNELAGRPDKPRVDNLHLSVTTLSKGHVLDVIMLQASPKGVLVSVGLDRSICIWTLKQGREGFDVRILKTDSNIRSLWPILLIAVGPCGQWLAICSVSGDISLYSLRDHRLALQSKIDLAGQQPRGLFVVPTTRYERSVLVILSDGMMAEIVIGSSLLQKFRICKNPLLASRVAYIPKTPSKIVALSRTGCVHLASKGDEGWISEGREHLGPSLPANGSTAVVPIPVLNMVLLIKSCEIDLMDLKTMSLIRTFQTEQVKPQTVRALHSPHRKCLSCGALCVGSLSITYTEVETNNCNMHTFTPIKKGTLICLRARAKGQQTSCAGFGNAHESLHWVENVGIWEATDINAVIGIRKRPTFDLNITATTDLLAQSPSSSVSRRWRGARSRLMSPSVLEPDDEWEAWSLSASGEIHTTQLSPPNELGIDASDQLLVSKPGPICKLGAQSVALGFGNVLKIIMLGKERFEEVPLGGYEDFPLPVPKHRRRGLSRMKSY